MRKCYLALCLGVVAVLFSRPHEVRAEGPIAAARIQKLVDDLAADDYSARQAATAELATCDQQAVQPLARAAAGDGLEAATRAVDLLRYLARTGDAATEAAATAALESLVETREARAINQATGALAFHRYDRQEDAMAEIERLGGAVDDLEAGGSYGVQVVLGESWKGGDAGLQQLRKIPDLATLSLKSAPVTDAGMQLVAELRTLKRLELYNVDNISDETVQKIVASIPDATIERRSGMLGIRGSIGSNNGCIVEFVLEDSAADEAELQPGDVITSLDGQQVTDFNHLQSLVSPRKAGEKIALKITRTGETITREVTLGRWIQ